MRLFTFQTSGDMLETASFFLNKSLTWRMVILGIPLIALSLLLVFVLTYTEIESLISKTIARNEQMHAESLALTFERILIETRNQLRILAAGEIDIDSMKRRFSIRKNSENLPYREIAYASSTSDERYVLLSMNKTLVELPESVVKNTRLSPFQTINETELTPFAVSISQPVEVTYSIIPVGEKLQSVTFQVIRLSTPIFEKDGKVGGVLILSLDLRAFRDIFSNSESPLTVKDEIKTCIQSFFIDYYGWILFQSERAKSQEDLGKTPLRHDAIRSGLIGDSGSPIYQSAFRPAPDYSEYYQMLEEIRKKKSGHIFFSKGDEGWSISKTHAECVSFAPVTFHSKDDSNPVIVGGIACLDKSFTSSHALSYVIKIFAVCFFLALILLSANLWWISQRTMRRLKLIENQLADRNQNDSSQPLSLPLLPLELEALRGHIDTLLLRLQRAESDQASRLAESNARKMTEPCIDLPTPEEVEQERIVGTSQVVAELRKQIETVAKISADVLVVGETGTGKELVSQAIHDASDRADKPFISINCGALDESLLMDTLFGHVKGAFTEAKQNRKGAFIAAEGGTLMLDEIGNAAPKVQQALLRALSTRCIRPLGSDQDIPFTARIIAATNADLRNDGKDGGFRNDLYFRLAVISLHTPPLRDRKDDIPALVVHFMREARAEQKDSTPLPAISKGALKKLTDYSWPGNVRELKNVITRAIAFSENTILQADDIFLDVEPEQAQEQSQPSAKKADLSGSIQSVLSQLNARQQAALPVLMRQGSITRQEYQNLSAEPISMRTAQYDLQQMVQLGLICRKGRGPSMSYFVEGFEEKKDKKDSGAQK